MRQDGRSRLPGNATTPSERFAADGALIEPAGGLVRQPVDKSLLAIPEPKRLRDKDHLRFVSSQPCLVRGRQPTEAHHLKFSQASALGRKVSDEFTVPVCALHHRDLHTTGNEVAWWQRKQIDPLPTARNLWAESHGWPQGDKVPAAESNPTASSANGAGTGHAS